VKACPEARAFDDMAEFDVADAAERTSQIIQTFTHRTST